MNYQWYPGHMTKARRMMQENIKLIDLVIELVDARIPISSRNPDIDELGKGKSRIILLNKSDLADLVWNKKWVEYFSNQGMGVLEINSRTGMGIKSIQGLVQEVCKEKIERDRKRGIVNRPVRAMVVGIPNVGKSTFINSFAGKAPGILWPKFEDQQVGMRLAFIGSMNDEILIPDELACDLIGAIKELYPKALQERYEADPAGKPIEILEAVAESRKCYAKGEQLDLGKAAGILIDDFRSGKLGRITLERI
mgnify:CR=1 FL=1